MADLVIVTAASILFGPHEVMAKHITEFKFPCMYVCVILLTGAADSYV